MTLKDILGKIPYSADLYNAIRPVRPKTRYNLSQLQAHLPAAAEQVRNGLGNGLGGGLTDKKGKRIVLFATLHYWVEQAAIIGLALRGMGHDVTIAYLPYSDWDKEINAFDLRRQDLYTQRVLKPLKGLVNVVSLLQPSLDTPLVPELEKAVEAASAFDTMYTLQVEDSTGIPTSTGCGWRATDKPLWRHSVCCLPRMGLPGTNPASKRFSSRTVSSPNWAFSTRWRAISI